MQIILKIFHLYMRVCVHARAGVSVILCMRECLCVCAYKCASLHVWLHASEWVHLCESEGAFKCEFVRILICTGDCSCSCLCVCTRKYVRAWLCMRVWVGSNVTAWESAWKCERGWGHESVCESLSVREDACKCECVRMSTYAWARVYVHGSMCVCASVRACAMECKKSPF